jgi:hypothetical protein
MHRFAVVMEKLMEMNVKLKFRVLQNGLKANAVMTNASTNPKLIRTEAALEIMTLFVDAMEKRIATNVVQR